MKNNSIALMWSLVGGISLLGMLGMLVSAADVTITIDSSNAIQHIESVTIEQENNPNNYVTMTRVGARLLKMQTNSNILLNENEISGTSTNSAILGGRENRIVRGGLSTIIAGIGNAITNEDEGGEGNVILGGEWNKIANSDLSTIAGGRGNFIEGRASTIVGGESNTISGDYSVIVGRENSVVGNNSVAMGVTSKINGNNSFLWTDSTREDELNADDVFVVVSEKGMVINSREPNPSAQLTVGGSIVMTMNDDDENVVCEGGQGAGTMKTVLTGDRYCLCSCDGEGRNSMFGQGECQSICDGNTQPVCGDDLYIVHSGSVYTFSGTCLSGNVVEGTGAYIVDKDNVVHWTCQIDNGEAVLCSGSNVIAMPSSCIFDGETIPHGGSVRGYSTSTPAGSCMEVSKMKVCNDGILSEPDYQYATCNNGCKKPWNNDYIPHGENVIAYRYSTVPFDVTCESPQTRTCNNGSLGGSYMYPSCTSQEVNGCFYEGDGIKYDHLSLLVTYDIPDGQCPDNGCDSHALVSRCYNGDWLNGDDQYWKVVGSDPKDVELIWPDIESIKVKPYPHKKCESHDSSNASTYTLSACDTNGTCSSADVSIADNNVDPKVSLVPLCETRRMYKIDSCNAGYYKNGESCVKCPDGYTSAAGATSQNGCYITCNDKEYLATPGASSCTTCENGRYSTGRQLSYGSTSTCGFCNNKPDNSYYTSNATTENGCSWTCNNGYTLNGGACEMVSAPECGSAAGGVYTSAPSNNLCSVGNLTGTVSTGTTAYTWECTNGSTGTISCTAIRGYICSSGTYLPANSTTCSTCTAGYYCPGGTYTKSSSIQGRNECGLGKYSSAGASSCSNCTSIANSYSWTSNGTSAISCGFTCNGGYKYNGTARTCTACGNGTYTVNGNTSTSCSSCTEISNRYSWTSKGTNATSCGFTCNGGYKYNGTNRTCTACDNGTYTTNGNTSTSCSNCTNKPSNSRYTSSYNCAWICNAGYAGSSSQGSTSCSACSTPTALTYSDPYWHRVNGNDCSFANTTCDQGYHMTTLHNYYYCVPNSSTTCFIAGTKVTMADGTQKNIEDVKIGEKVLGADGIVNTVLGYDRPLLGNRHLWSINGSEYFVSDEHPFMTTEGWKSFNPEMTKIEVDLDTTELKVGDMLVTSNGVEEIKSVDYISADSDTPLYNFELDGDHTYHANNYLVHNKGGDTPSCFLAGTPVITVNGSKNIEDIEEGDIVLSYDTITKKYEYNKVLDKLVHENSTDDVYTFVIDGNVLEATELHRFYVVGHNNWPYQCHLDYYWASAKYLKAGDQLMRSDGTVATIESVSHRSNFSTTYNLHVDNAHTYFVGKGYLVHNSDKPGGDGKDPVNPGDGPGAGVRDPRD